ncbi:MAG: FtsL-like putative cell division protein [Flavobacteriales bacterium]
MAKRSIRRYIRSFLKGTIFQQKEVRKHGGIAIYVFLWMLIVIYFSGSADQKIYKIKKLEDKRRQAKSEHVGYRTKRVGLTKPSIVIKEVEELGLKHSFVAPKYIEVEDE